MVNNNSYCQVMACLRENSSSHFIIEVKSCWAGFVSGWVTILVFLCCMPGEGRLVLCFTLAPPTSAIVCGLSFSQSHPDMGFFLRVLWFFSLSKSTPSQKHLACVLCSGIIDDHLVAARGAFDMHLADPVELHPSQFSPRGHK